MKFPNAKWPFFQRFLLWTAIGFAVIVAAGPILTVLSLAALGFVVWIVFRCAFRRRYPAWQRTRKIGQNLAAAVLTAGSWSLPHLTKFLDEAVRFLDQTSRSAYEHGAHAAGRAWIKTRQNARFLASFVLETVGGAAVGGLLGYVLRNGTDESHPAVMTGAIIGAFLGILVAASRYQAAAESTVRS